VAPLGPTCARLAAANSMDSNAGCPPAAGGAGGAEPMRCGGVMATWW